MLSLAPTFVLSYLLGSLVAGVVYSRWRGDDIRERDLPGGSGTYRQYGKGAAIVVSALDILKGAAAVGLAGLLTSSPSAGWVATLGVVLGHCYPAFFGLRGGGGIAPFLGALLVAAPLTLLLTLAFALVMMPLYRATLQRRIKLNVIPFVTAVTLPVSLLLAARLGGLWEVLAGGAAMGVRALHLLASRKPGAGA